MKRRLHAVGLQLFAFLLGAATWFMAAADSPPRPKRITTVLLQAVTEADLVEIGPRRRAIWAKHGLVEGRDYYETIAYPKDTSDEAMRRLAREVVASRPDVILTNGGSQTVIFQKLTRDIPIVFCCVSDPLGAGIVQSLNRPGGNTTGTSSNVGELKVKSLELLRELLPRARRIAFLIDLEPGEEDRLPWSRKDMPERAAQLGLEIVRILDTRNKSKDQLQEELCAAKADAFMTHTVSRVELRALQQGCRIPGFGTPGLLGALAPHPDEHPHQRAMEVAARVVRGANPATLPVTQIVRVQLILNLRTAREFGIEIPASILTRADQVFQ
jgi:putative tryptophan/tyrosine transport system substrate-binding protein